MGRRISTDDLYKAGEFEDGEKSADAVGENTGEPSEAAVDNPDPAGSESEPCVFVYLGPTIRGVITNGGIFAGTREEISKRFEKSIEKYPQINRLIVADIGVAKAREMLAKGEGAISVAYKKLAESINKEV